MRRPRDVTFAPVDPDGAVWLGDDLSFYEDTMRPLVLAQRDAHLALGRPALAARATTWLAWHPE